MITPTPARPTVAAGQTPTPGPRNGRHGSPGSAVAPFRTPTMTMTNLAGGGLATGRRTPGTAQRLQASAARTPHARAALLALDNRRAAILTPGGRQSRRKSGRYMRESPRDLLRNLSRRLAPQSQPIRSSSSASSSSPAFSPGVDSSSRRRKSRRMGTITEDDDDDDDDGLGDFSVTGRYDHHDNSSSPSSVPLHRPRMSLPIGDDDDNDDDLQPHRSMILDEDENFTMRSIEFARRTATSDNLQQARRFSRGSLGSLRMSDYIDGFIGSADGDVDNDQDERLRSSFFPDGAFDNLAADEQPTEDMTFERLDSESGQQALAGRESGFGVVDVPLDGNETTFLLGQGADQTLPADETTGPVFPDNDDDNNNDNGNDNNDYDNRDDVGVPFDDYGDDNEGGGWVDEPDDPEELEEPDVEMEDSAEATTATTATAATAAITATDKTGRLLPREDTHRSELRGKRVKLSRHGIQYPSLPVGVVKRIAQTFAQGNAAGNTKLSPETVAALSTASDWFFEQVGIDLERYAKHAGRKTIDESDVLLLMKRQRQVSTTATPFSLAQRFMPRELLQELRMIPEASSKGRQKRPPRTSTGGRVGAAIGEGDGS